MAKIRIKLFLPLILGGLLLMDFGKSTILVEDMIDLKSNSSGLLSIKESFFRLDSYVDVCLNKFERCETGFTVLFNISLSYLAQDGLIVLATSGGDSSYTSGGFYLHQIRNYGENYLEFGIGTQTRRFISKIYLIENVNIGLAFVWDSNKQILKSYVDGFLFESIFQPMSRSYWSLNFNPIKYFESLTPLVGNLLKRTVINSALFKNITFDHLEPLLRGSIDNYFIGCFVANDITLTPVKLNVSEEYSTLSDIEQCKITCIGQNKQIFLIGGDLNCYCELNSKTLNQKYVKNICSTDPVPLKAYTASNLNFDRFYVTDLDLEVTKISKNDQIEIEDPIGFKIVSKNSLQNFRTTIDFGENTIKAGNGDCFLFHQFTKSGTYKVKITSVPLNSVIIKKNQTFLFDITVLGKLDKQPMFSVKMDVSSKTIIDSKWNVNVSITVSGGSPYSCNLNFGDATNTKYDLMQRLNVFYVNHVYDYTGIYKLTLNCLSKNVPESSVQDSKIVYLPYKKNYDYSISSNGYSIGNFMHYYKVRSTSDKTEYSLELPFQIASSNLTFLVDDLISNKNGIHQWTSSDQNLKTNGNMSILIKASLLKNFNENYFQVRSCGIVLASYLITIEDLITQAPIIKTITQPLRQNEPVNFEISIQPTSPSCLIYIIFNGDKTSLQFYQLNALSSADLVKPYVLTTSYVFPESQLDNNVQVIVANHVSQQSSMQQVQFESSLNNFVLSVYSNLSDPSQEATFKLQPVGNLSLGYIKLESIQIYFDGNDRTKTKNLTKFTFNKLNDFSLIFTYKYSQFGFYNIWVNCTNLISYVITKTSLRIGTNLNSVSGNIQNNYANIRENIYVPLKVNGGNGYDISVDFNDGNTMILPWSYLSSNGVLNEPSRQIEYPNDLKIVPPKAMFNKTSTVIMYKYSTPGEYYINVRVRNPFGALELTFCSKVYIQAAPIDKSDDADKDCLINYNNLNLFIETSLNTNPVMLIENSLYKLAKGLQNTFSVNFNSKCNNTEILNSSNIQTYWQLSSRITQNGLLVDSIIDKYCFVKSSNNLFVLKPYELDAGDYSLKVYAFEENEPQNYVFFTNYMLSIGSTPLVVKLNKGEKIVELNENETLTLDFYTQTYDPDLLSDNEQTILDKKNFEFYFVCVEGGDTNPDRSTLIKSAQAKANKFSFDFETLGFSLKFKSFLTNLWFYEHNCFVQTNQTNVPQIEFDEKTKIISINSNNLNINDTGIIPISIQLFARKNQRISSVELKVQQNMSSFFVIPDASDFDKMSEALSRLDDFAKQNPKGALKLLDGFVNAINSKSDEEDSNYNMTTTTTLATPQDNSNKTEQYAKLRGQMLGTVGTILDRVDDADSLIMAAGATAGVSANTKQMNSNNQESGSEVVATLGAKAENIDPEMVGALAGSMLNCGGNMLVAGADTAAIDNSDRLNSTFLEPQNDTEPEAAPLPAKISVPLKFYEQDGEDFPEDLNDMEVLKEEEIEFKAEVVRNKTADIAKKTFGGISNAGKALIKASNVSNTTEGGNFTQAIESNGMALIVSKSNVNQTSNETATFSSSSGSSIKMPSLNAVIGPNENGSIPSAVSTNMIVSNSNPFQSTKGSSSGTIVSLKLSDENGTELVVNNTAEPFVIVIPAASPADLFQSSVGLLDMIYHKLYLPTNTSSLHIDIIPVVPGDFYHIYVKYSLTRVIDIQPSEKSHDYAFTLPNNKIENELKRHSIFIPQNETKGNGTYYIGVKLAKLSNTTILELKEKNLTANNSIRSFYSIRLYTTSCKYWKESSKEWSTDGCEVGDGTDHLQTECKCTHLTTFGTDFYVPPNTIDFSTVFSKFDIAGNPSVFATIVSILGLYVIIAIFLRWKDKKDLIKWGATPLCDNLPTDMFYYLISVQTGFGRDTSTTSKVGFVLSGEFADSGVRKLTDDKRKAFKSGSVCNFIMSTEEALGPLTYLRIWHDNSGSGNSKSWYLNTVDIVDLQTNEKSSFVCNSWLAVEKGDGQIDRVLPVACKNDLISFKHLFGQSVKKKFSDNHLWFSVFSRPTKSSFTRLQRMTCCMSLLFCTMIANAQFYKPEDGKAKSGTITLVGPIKFSMGQLFTSIVSTLIVVPVNILIVTLFRKAKLKNHGIVPTKQNHVAKQQYWRRVKVIENIELPDDDEDRSEEFTKKKNKNFNSKYETDNNNTSIKRKPSFFKSIFEIKDFKEQKSEYKREDSKEDARNKKQGRTLPHWVIYIAYGLCSITILVPAFFCILYSMQWGKERSDAWLISMVLSFFQSLLVVDPIKVFIITAIITCILRKPEVEEESLINSGDPLYNAIVNKDEEYLHENNQITGLSQINVREILESRRAKLTTLNPIDPEELEQQRIERKKVIKMKEILYEGFSYLLFLIVVLFLAHQSRSRNANLIYQDLSNTFLNNPDMAFTDIQTRDDFWSYLDSVFIPGLYAPRWYNDNPLSWREKLTTINRAAIRVGAPRLRQLRIKENTCIIFSKFRGMINHCRTDYNWVDDDTRDYEKKWVLIKKKSDQVSSLETTSSEQSTTTPVTTTTTKAPEPVKIPPSQRKKSKYKCQNAWCYQDTIQTKSTPIAGIWASYKGGGYVQSLSRTLEASNKTIIDLRENGWVDELTRAVFLEFTMYNPNVNLFATITLLVEYLSTGAPVHYTSISVCSLYNYLGSFGIVVLVFEIIFVIFIVYYLICEIIKIKNERCGYFKKFWNLNEMGIIIFSIIAMIMFAMRSLFTALAIKAVHESELGEFVNFNTIGQWDELYTQLSAVIVFCSTLKFLKLLRFNKHIGIVAAALRFATKDLIGFFCTFIIVFAAFAQFGYTIFGSTTKSYSNFMTAVESIFRFSLGQYVFSEFYDADHLLGPIYFVLFILFVFMGLMSMFVTIINEGYEKAKEMYANGTPDQEIIHFIFDTAKNAVKGKKEKLNKKNKTEAIDDSTESFSVTIRQKMDPKDTFDIYNPYKTQYYSASNNSINRRPPTGQFEDHDSLSLF